MHLVIGGTGNVGRQVVSGLLGEHVDVRVFSRSPQRHPGWDGVDLVAGDLSSAVGLDEALDGVETVFLLWPLFDSSHAARVVTAIAARARRVVYLSSVAVRDDLEIQRHSYSAFHREIERLIAESGVEWTVLRATSLATNTLGYAEQIRSGAPFCVPFGNRTPVHERDVAAVAVRAMLDDGHGEKTYVVSGPESLTELQRIRQVADALGRILDCREYRPVEFRAEMAADGESLELTEEALSYWTMLLTTPEPTTDTVLSITGRPPRRFSEWVRDHIEDFR